MGSVRKEGIASYLTRT